MPKKKTASPPSKLRKIAVQGISVPEVLELEAEICTDVRFHMAVVFLGAAVLGQIRLQRGPKTKPSDFTRLESVRMYNKRVLAKSPSLLHLAACVALRRTLVAHASDPDSSLLTEAFRDLITNTTGESSTNDNIKACIGNPARLRRLRRGYMLQVTGSVQATPVHNPNSMGMDLTVLDKSNFLLALPFETSDVDRDAVFATVKDLLGLSEGYILEDCINLGTPDNLVPLERSLGYSRSTGSTLAQLNIPKSSDSDPTWKKLAVKAAKKTFES